MQKCHFNSFHHRGTCTTSSSFSNIQDNTSHFWIIQTITSGFSNQLILLFLQGRSLLCCKMVLARKMVPRNKKGIFVFKRENTSLLSWLPRAWWEWLGHHLPCSWHCRGCKLERNSHSSALLNCQQKRAFPHQEFSQKSIVKQGVIPIKITS